MSTPGSPHSHDGDDGGDGGGGTLPTCTIPYDPTRKLRRKTEKTVLPTDYEPSKFSVICGRGKGSYQSDGNVNFRELVKNNLDRYRDAPGRLEKSFIVSEVLNMIRESCPVGAFVKYEKGRWYDLDDAVCREKVGSLFRDFLHTEYKSSSKAKHARKVAEKSTQGPRKKPRRASTCGGTVTPTSSPQKASPRRFSCPGQANVSSKKEEESVIPPPPKLESIKKPDPVSAAPKAADVVWTAPSSPTPKSKPTQAPTQKTPPQQTSDPKPTQAQRPQQSKLEPPQTLQQPKPKPVQQQKLTPSPAPTPTAKHVITVQDDDDDEDPLAKKFYDIDDLHLQKLEP